MTASNEDAQQIIALLKAILRELERFHEQKTNRPLV
jgi:hypothetical protein